MASTWSALKIELLETGANSGTWGTATNVNLGDAVLGEVITGSATVDFPSAADVTITLTDSATTQSARNLRLNITESGAGIGYAGNLILGSNCQIEKFYLIRNNGTGVKTIKNTTGTGIAVAAGKATLVYNDGTNVVDVLNSFSSAILGAENAGSIIPFYFANQAAFPSASTYHGAIAHSHADGAMFFAHGGAWVRLIENGGPLGTPSGGTATYLTGLPLTTGVTGLLPVANGGTATATPSIVAGTNVTVTGTWPNQTIASSSSGGVSYTAVKTANYTAANNDGVLTNTTGGAFTVTLPTSPSVGNIVLVIDSLSQWGTNNLTVDPTALIKIAGNTAGDTLVCDITGATVTLVYTGATYGWNVAAQVGGNGGTAVTLTGTQTLTNKTLTSPTLTTPVASTTIGVGAATAAASGAGITFPATQSASSDANTLDDYEEGTWTPTLGGTATYTSQGGSYTKIGRLVTAQGWLVVNAIGTGATNNVSGLPFTCISQTVGIGGSVGYFENLNNNVVFITPEVQPSGTTIVFNTLAAAGGITSYNTSLWKSTTRLSFINTYFV